MMSNNAGYTEDQVVRQLKRKADIRIVGKQIQELREGKGDVGIGSRGKIDYLLKQHNYIHFFVQKFQ